MRTETEGMQRASAGGTVPRRSSRTLNVVLWIVQVFLALLFAYAGWVKLSMPSEALAKVAPLPVPFLKFIGVAELLGAAGLVLPWLTGIRPGLTPLAAACLVVIMIGAVVVTLATMPAAWAVLPLVTGALATFVAIGRWRLAPGRRA